MEGSEPEEGFVSSSCAAAGWLNLISFKGPIQTLPDTSTTGTVATSQKYVYQRFLHSDGSNVGLDVNKTNQEVH